MVNLFGMEMPESDPERFSEMRRLAGEAELSFQNASEEEQMLHLLAQQISFVYGGVRNSKEQVARMLITKSHGPKFAERVLTSPELRQKIGLDEAESGTPSAVCATTVVVED